MLKISEENRIGKSVDFDELIVNKSAKITDIDSMFWENEDYDVISLDNLFFENLKSSRGTFESCERVGEITLIGNANKTLDLSYMFYNCLCLYKLFFLIDCDEYIMSSAFDNCVQLNHLVCYERFKNQFMNNKHLNCPKFKESDYELYAMTVDKYKFIESLIIENFEITSIDKFNCFLDIKKICYLYNDENEKLGINEIEGVYGTSKKFIIVFNKDNNCILNNLSRYIKKAYKESINEILCDLQFGEDIIEEMKFNIDELNEILDLNKLVVMKMFIDTKNPILDYVCENNKKNHLVEYTTIDNCEIDNGVEREYDNCISIYEKKYKKQLALNKIEKVTKKPIAELKYFFSNLEWYLFDEDSNKLLDEYSVNRIVLYILDYYKVFDEFKYYGIEMSDYYSYLIEDIQNYNIIEWAYINYEDDIHSRGDLKIAEYFNYLEFETEDAIELSKLKDHLHLYSNIRNSLINKYGINNLRDKLCISNSYENFKEKRVLYKFKLKKYYNNRINMHLLILLIEKNGWNDKLLNDIFNVIISNNLDLYEKNASVYRSKCLCDATGIELYNKCTNKSVEIEAYSKEFDFSYELFYQLKSLGIKNFIDLLSINWQWYIKEHCSLDDKNYKELVSKLLYHGIDIRFYNNNDSILILGLPTSIIYALIESNINSIRQLISLNEYELADILLNDDENFEFLSKRLTYFGISLNNNDENLKLSFLYDKIVNINNDAINFNIKCPLKLENPKIELKRYEESFIVEGRLVDKDSVQFVIDNVSVVGDYTFSIFDSDKLIVKNLPLKLQKKGLKIKDNH